MRPLLLRRVRLMPGESLTSYASRLAACNRVSLPQFCEDLGIGGTALVRGEDEPIHRLSELSGEAAGSLVRAAVRRTAASRHSINGEALLRSTLRRLELVVCPLCLSRDVAGGALPAHEAAYARLDWSLSQVDACPVHDVELARLGGSVDRRVAPHDFVARITPFLPRLAELGARAQRRVPTGLQAYLMRRLAGAAGGSPWLDAHPLFAAAIACERVGVTASLGPEAVLSRLSAEQWRRAGEVGYEHLSQGPTGLDPLCARLTARRRKQFSGVVGPQPVYGNLWIWLDRGARDPAYDPLRAALAERIFGSLALPAGTRVLGHVLERRRLHSVASAAVEGERNPRNLRTILTAAGLLPEGHEDRLNWQVVFDADAVAPYLDEPPKLLGTADLMTILGLGHAAVADLHRSGLLAHVPRVKGKRTARLQFEQPIVDAFVSRLFAGSSRVQEAGPGEFDLVKCAQKARCSISSVVGLVLDGKLAWRARLAGATGLRALLLRHAEVRRHVREAERTELPLQHVMGDLHMIRTHVVNLMQDGVLRTREARHIRAKLGPLGVVAREDLDAFKAEYVSLSNLARETGMTVKEVNACLAAAGVTPGMPRERYGPIYRRSDIPRLDAEDASHAMTEGPRPEERRPPRRRRRRKLAACRPGGVRAAPPPPHVRKGGAP